MRSLLVSLVLLSGCLLGVGSARAYTPENGVWWTPSEPGTGITVEIQDNFVAMSLYYYDAQGFPEWYTATGFLQGNSVFEAEVERFFGGTCLGCAWRPNAEDGSLGRVRVEFDPEDPMRATLRFAGRTVPIQRFHYYLQRPEDRGRPAQLTRALGEWSAVIDFSEVRSGDALAYDGDVLLFDLIDTSEAPGYIEGCRADNSIDGFCSTSALAWHSAAGYYDSRARRHVIVVDDSRDHYVTYVIQLGTNDFRGGASVYRKGGQPGTYHPVRGFRTASRTFVEEGYGPSKRAAAAASGAVATQPGAGLAARLPAEAFAPKSAAAGVDVGLEPARLDGIRRSLEARLAQPRTTAAQ